MRRRELRDTLLSVLIVILFAAIMATLWAMYPEVP